MFEDYSGIFRRLMFLFGSIIYFYMVLLGIQVITGEWRLTSETINAAGTVTLATIATAYYMINILE